MLLLDINQKNRLIQSANAKRKKYIESTRYPYEMLSIFSQHLNLSGNDIFDPIGNEPSFIHEYMDVYRQLLNDFSSKKSQKLKKSIQNSIYASIEHKLLYTYIDELKNNDPDSFLVLPISDVFRLPGWFSRSVLHGITAIVKKESDKIIVDVYDKAQKRLFYPSSAKDKKLLEKLPLGKKDSEILITPIYSYQIENKTKYVLKIAEALRVAGLNISWWERYNPFSSYKTPHYFYKKMSACAEKEDFKEFIATTQYVQDNCAIKNMDGAFKHVLGNKMEVIVKEGENTKVFMKSTMTMTTIEKNKKLCQLFEEQLSKVGYDCKKVLNDMLKDYTKAKLERKNLCRIDKITKKIEEGNVFNKSQKVWEISKLQNKMEADHLHVSLKETERGR